MQKLLLATTTAIAVLAFAPGRADAMTVGSSTGLQAAIETLDMTQDVRTVCRHRYYTSGTRCWWVPGWRRWRRW